MNSLTNKCLREKKVLFCLQVKKKTLPLQPLNFKERIMNVTNLTNLAVMHIIRVVVVTSRGEKGCMSY